MDKKLERHVKVLLRGLVNDAKESDSANRGDLTLWIGANAEVTGKLLRKMSTPGKSKAKAS